MKSHRRLGCSLVIAAALLAGASSHGREALERIEAIVKVGGEAREVCIPSGFSLEMLTEALQSPRLLTFAPDGDLFIGSKAGRVYRLRSPYREPDVFAEAGGYPHGVAFRPGEILIAYTDGIYATPHTPRRSPLGRGEQRLIAALPSARKIAVQSCWSGRPRASATRTARLASSSEPSRRTSRISATVSLSPSPPRSLSAFGCTRQRRWFRSRGFRARGPLPPDVVRSCARLPARRCGTGRP